MRLHPSTYPACTGRVTKDTRRDMSVPCEGSMKQTGCSPIPRFSLSRWLPAHFTSANWPTCSHSISRRDQWDFMRIGSAWKIRRMRYCLHVPTLLAIVNDQGSPIIQFSHFFVKEFLTSTRSAEATDSISYRYNVFMPPAHTLKNSVDGR